MIIRWLKGVRSDKLLFIIQGIMNYQNRDWDDIIIVSLVQLNAFCKNIILQEELVF